LLYMKWSSLVDNSKSKPEIKWSHISGFQMVVQLLFEIRTPLDHFWNWTSPVFGWSLYFSIYCAPKARTKVRLVTLGIIRYFDPHVDIFWGSRQGQIFPDD
jgi:hypothetical protein